MPSAGRQVWCLEIGAWYLVLGNWSLEIGAWYLVFGNWCLVFGIWWLGAWDLVLSILPARLRLVSLNSGLVLLIWSFLSSAMVATLPSNLKLSLETTFNFEPNQIAYI